MLEIETTIGNLSCEPLDLLLRFINHYEGIGKSNFEYAYDSAEAKVYADANIQDGEEILGDYGDGFFEEPPKDPPHNNVSPEDEDEVMASPSVEETNEERVSKALLALGGGQGERQIAMDNAEPSAPGATSSGAPGRSTSLRGGPANQGRGRGGGRGKGRGRQGAESGRGVDEQRLRPESGRGRSTHPPTGPNGGNATGPARMGERKSSGERKKGWG